MSACNIITSPISVPKPSYSRFRDIEGRTFNRLTVLSYAGKKTTYHYWNCLCSCGNITIKSGSYMEKGIILSCGCLHKERNLEACVTHGESGSPEFVAYHKAKSRCNNANVPDFDYWGGRGIEFRFHSLQEFVEHIGRKPTPSHSLDRIDTNGHYEIGNVRWATKSEQSNNQRSNVKITINGETLSQTEWGDRTGIGFRRISRRLRLGWCPECSVMIPIRKGTCSHREV